MASVNLGKVGLLLRGAWDSSTDYAALDVVSHYGYSYAARVANKNVEPSAETSAYWQPLAESTSVLATMLGYKNDAADSATAAAESATAAATSASSATDALANEAADFSSSKAYAIGDYVIYNNGTHKYLYRFTAAHSAGAWVGTDATQVALADDVSTLKSAVDAIQDDLYTEIPSPRSWSVGNWNSSTGGSGTNNKRIKTSTPTIDGLDFLIKAEPGVLFFPVYWDESGTFIETEAIFSSEVNIADRAPEGAAGFRLNAKTDPETIMTDIVDSTAAKIHWYVLKSNVIEQQVEYLKSAVADQYDPDRKYRAGEYAWHDGQFVKSLCAIDVPESFVENKWIVLDIKNELYNIEHKLISFSSISEYAANNGYITRKNGNRFILNCNLAASSTSYRFYIAGNLIATSSNGSAASLTTHPTELVLQNGHIYEAKATHISGTATDNVYITFHGFRKAIGGSTYGFLNTDGFSYARMAYNSEEDPNGIGIAIYVARRENGNDLQNFTIEVELYDITDQLAIAPVEHEKSEENHAIGDVFWLESTLYKVTETIASGESIVPGTNVIATTVMEELSALKALIANN